MGHAIDLTGDVEHRRRPRAPAVTEDDPGASVLGVGAGGPDRLAGVWVVGHRRRTSAVGWCVCIPPLRPRVTKVSRDPAVTGLTARWQVPGAARERGKRRTNATHTATDSIALFGLLNWDRYMARQRVEQAGLHEEFPDPAAAPNVTDDPGLDELRELAGPDETTTGFGGPAYVSDQKSRSADRTKNLVDHEFEEADWDVIEAALEAAGERDLVCLDREVGRQPETSFVCRLFVPRRYARVALAWGTLMEPAPEGAEPDFQTLQLPDWDDRLVRVLPEAGLTFVLGSDYTGEAKKSFLRLYMYRAKQRGGLGIHAGTKRLCIDHETEGDGDGDGEEADGLATVGQAFLGLSATGKSTLTGHRCWLEDPEGAEVLQDDVCALLPDGTVTGSEGAGLYIKTDGLDREEQPALYDAATDDSAVFENVAVDSDGGVDFDDGSLTTNGRAAIRRACLDSASEDIDLEQLDQLFFITRNPLMPPIARLDDRQAAVAFMLGESVQTSAGDPDAAGEAIRVVGTNPFVVGPEGEEGNRFYDLVRDTDIETFVINTGQVGPGAEGVDIGVEDSVTILTCVARGEVEWRADDRFGFEVPVSVPGVDVTQLYPPDHYDEFTGKLADLRAERRAYLAGFETLAEEIREAVY